MIATTPDPARLPGLRPLALDVDETDDSIFLGKLRAGDGEAFECLVRAHGGRLLASARRLLRDERDAEDAVQEGFLAAFRALPAFRAECRLSTWLHRIVLNTALMKLRARRRRPEAPIEPLLPVFLPNGEHALPQSRQADAEQALMTKELRARVRSAIDQLPDSYRTVLLLRDIEELDTNTVASMLGLTTNATKIRLHRARLAVATLLRPAVGRTPAA